MAGGALSFREDPFRLTPDRRYIFETDGFRRAFAILLAGVRARRGAMLLTGPSGTGKTTLLQGLLGKLKQDGATIFWRFHPDIPGYDLIGSCLSELEIEEAPADPIGRAQALANAIKTRSQSLAAVLIVDEAGQFSDAQLAEIVALPAATSGALQVILAGLPAVAERLDSDELFALKDAIALRAELGPLARGELGAYIAHRCRVAGQAGPLAFEPAAIARVFHHTGGTPRLVNRLCATALFFAPAGAKQIAAAVIDEAARACAGEPPTGEVQISGMAAPAATGEPETPAKAPEHQTSREPPSQVHRTLAEAERAWISGGALQSASQETPASAVDSPSAEELVPVSATPAAPLVSHPTVLPAAAATLEVPVIANDAARKTKAAPIRHRSKALRIAASVAVIGASATALMAALWPAKIDHDYLAASPPAKAVARLLVAEDAAPKPVAAPAAVAGEAVLPPEPPPQTATIVSMAPIEAQPEAAASFAAPHETKTEPVLAKLEAAMPELVIAEPPPEPELPPVASAIPATETSIAPSAMPASDAVSTPQPEQPARAAASERTIEAASTTSESPGSVVEASSLAEIAPANGPRSVQDASKDEPAAAPADSPNSEPPPLVALAALPPQAESPAAPPAAKLPESPAVVAVTPPPPVPSAPRTAQASAPSANPAELQQLMARGDDMMRLGDPASARLFYERAAARGLARAYTAVGRTYDPLALQQLNIRGGGANGEQALAWYRRGADAGDKDAARATSDLTAWLARPR